MKTIYFIDNEAFELVSCDHGFRRFVNEEREIVITDRYMQYRNKKTDELHRLDGPALIGRTIYNFPEAIDVAEWFVNGMWIDFKAICERHELPLDYKTWTDAEKTLFRLAV